MDFKVSYTTVNDKVKCILAYKVGDKWKQTTSQKYTRQKDYKHWIDKRKRELEGINPSNISDLDMTVKDLILHYKEDIASRLTHNTILAYNTVFEAIYPLHEVKVLDVRHIHLKKHFKNLSNYSMTTQKLHLTVLKTMFKFAVEDLEIIGKNPCSKIKLSSSVSQDKKLVITTKEFHENLLPLMTRPDYRLIAKIALNTGMRIGEIEGLTYDCIKKDHIIVSKQWKLLTAGKYGFGELKSKNGNRTIPVAESLIQEVLQFRKVYHTDLTNRIFWKHKSAQRFTAYLSRILKGTNYEGFTAHNFRHSYVSILIEKGLDFKTISELAGDSLEMVLKTYSHVNSDAFDRAKNIIEKAF